MSFLMGSIICIGVEIIRLVPYSPSTKVVLCRVKKITFAAALAACAWMAGDAAPTTTCHSIPVNLSPKNLSYPSYYQGALIPIPISNTPLPRCSPADPLFPS